MLTDKQIVQKARELITPKKAWTQNSYARDKDGMGIDAWNSQATCWCMLGAITKVAEDNGQNELDICVRLSASIRETGCTNGLMVPTFNDGSTHKQVLAALDCAIEKMAE